MGRIDESEQWKLDGLCSKCRKKKYCGTTCKAAVQSDRRYIEGLAAKMFYNAFFKKPSEKGEALKEIGDEIYERARSTVAE